MRGGRLRRVVSLFVCMYRLDDSSSLSSRLLRSWPLAFQRVATASNTDRLRLVAFLLSPPTGEATGPNPQDGLPSSWDVACLGLRAHRLGPSRFWDVFANPFAPVSKLSIADMRLACRSRLVGSEEFATQDHSGGGATSRCPDFQAQRRAILRGERGQCGVPGRSAWNLSSSSRAHDYIPRPIP